MGQCIIEQKRIEILSTTILLAIEDINYSKNPIFLAFNKFQDHFGGDICVVLQGSNVQFPHGPILALNSKTTSSSAT